MNKYGAEFFGTFWLVLGGCGRDISRSRNRLARGRTRIRTDSADNGLCDRPHLRLPPESSGFNRALGRGAIPGERPRTLYRLPGAGPYRCRRYSLPHSLWKGRI